MRTTTITAILLSLAVLSWSQTASETQDPVRDYAKSFGLTPGRSIFRWEIALKRSGRKDVLIATKLTQSEVLQEGKNAKWQNDLNVTDFSVYLKSNLGPNYVGTKGLELENGDLVLGGGLEVDITQCYVGEISQLKRYGLVTIQTDHPSEGPAISYIFAYTVENDHLKRSLLGKFNPDARNSQVYDEYFFEGKRTKVELEEVKIGKPSN